MQKGMSRVEAVGPLIKLVKEREDLYFELLAFVNKNIQSSSNDLDNLTIFNKFLTEIKSKNNNIKSKQTGFLANFDQGFADTEIDSDDPKELLRLASRIIEILEASITRVRKGVFDESGKALKEFNRFKIMLNKILKRQTFIIRDYAEYILNYCNNKFQKQILKINKYVEKVEAGEDIFLRELYFKQSSDAQISPPKEPSRIENKPQKKVDMTEHLSSTQEQQKKTATHKKTSKVSTKRRERILSIRKQQKQHQEEQNQQPPTPTKEQTANKLLKFYSLLQLNRKQFLQDYVYDKLEEERHREDLLNKLLQRNKQINKQINNFVRKSSLCIPAQIAIPIANKSSGDERNQSASSKISLRASFIISKRKSSFHFDSSDGQKKERDKDKEVTKQGNLTQQIIKNIHPRRRSSQSNRAQAKSRQLFVVKAPMVFQEEIIPQVQIVQTQWLQAPLSSKPRERKNENVRLKRKNNPAPLDNAFFPQNFRYPL